LKGANCKPHLKLAAAGINRPITLAKLRKSLAKAYHGGEDATSSQGSRLDCSQLENKAAMSLGLSFCVS